MGIKLDTETKTYSVFHSKRHPETRVPVSLRRIGIVSRAEANRTYQELVVAVEDKIRRQTLPTWRVFIDKYLTEIGNENALNKTTIYNRDKVVKFHTLDSWGNRLIDEIKTQDVHNILNERFADKSESHKKFFVKCLRGIFQYAVDQDLLVKNPTPLLKFKANEKIKSVLNEEQIGILLRKAQELGWEWYPHYAVALFTGMRNGELYALTWDKVNFEHEQILVNCSWSSKDGYKSTKSGDDRKVEIPKPLIPVLAELKLQSDGIEFVLPRMYKWDKGEQARFLRAFLISIGLPKIRFHDLRASWATLLLSKGVAPSKVMAMGGWKDMDTMMIYMRKAGIDIKGATSCLDDMHIHGIQAAKVVNLREP